MLPIKIKDGIASLIVNKTRKLTPRQLLTLERTRSIRGESAADRYLANLLGLNKDRVDIRRVVSQYGMDRLKAKPKGSIASMFRRLQENDEDVHHTPSKRSVGHWIGVEIECYYPVEKHCTGDCDHDNGECYPEADISEDRARQIIRDALIKAGVTRSSVKDDGSLDNPEGSPVEVTLLFNAEDGFGQLEKTCKVLNDLGCFVDKNCGLHVHLDSRHLKPRGARLLGQRLGRTLPVLKYLVDPSRHTNNYCKVEVGPMERNREQRYYAVNMNAYFRYKTIEVRLHGGSTNFSKIKNWIELLRFVASNKVPKTLVTFQDLIDLGIPEHLVEYADARISKLNPAAWSILTPPNPLVCDANGNDRHGRPVNPGGN